MKYQLTFSLGVVFLNLMFVLSCTPKIQLLQYHAAVEKMVLPKSYKAGCRNPLNYVPDSLHPEFNVMRRVRINWHCIDDTTRANNFNEAEGKNFLWGIAQNANERLRDNWKMALPLDNNTPVYDPMIQWMVWPSKGYEKENGYYFQTQQKPLFFINKGARRTDYNDDVIHELGIGLDSIVNVFVVPFPPDSIGRMKVKMNESGIALNNHVKLGGLFQSKKPSWEFSTLLTHEIFHTFGLSHAWHTDGCDDTPEHTNCWNYSDTPPCDKYVSNNIMDYNSQQMSVSPCQIGKIHMRIADTLSHQRRCVIADWCINDTSKLYIIADSVQWLGARDINRSIVIEKGGVLKVCCRLSMPPGSFIKVKNGGKLILEEVTIHNDCNQHWNGIIVEKKGEESGIVEEWGKVQLLDIELTRM